MPSRIQQFREQFGLLSKVDKTFLIALIVRLVYSLASRLGGVELPAGGLIRFLFVVIAIVFLIRSGPRLLRKALWRVRHRLILTWVLVGVVPIVLICVLVGL